MKRNIYESVNYLPLNIQSRVELCLTLRNLKPSSVITLRNLKENSLRRVKRFLLRNKIYYSIDKKDNHQYFVSLDEKTTNSLASCWYKNSDSSEEEKGKLLGYPKSAVLAFVRYSRDPDRPKFLTGIFSRDFPRSSILHWPYIGYIVRKSHEEEDSLVAKKWSDYLKQNNPVLAAWYEKKIMATVKSII